MTMAEGQECYREFLSNLNQFERALKLIKKEWTHSCETFLSNGALNRIAWLGQAACSRKMKLPSTCRGGFKLLSTKQQKEADELAAHYLLKIEIDMKERIQNYIDSWKSRGYPESLPEELPERIVSSGFAPSYKAICVAILKNDHSLSSLGFSPKPSEWYKILKGIEIAQRPQKKTGKAKKAKK